MDGKISGKKIIGAKQTIRTVKGGTAKTVYIAEDADAKVTRPIIETCLEFNVEVVYVPTMDKLGKMCSIEVGAAAACVLKE